MKNVRSSDLKDSFDIINAAQTIANLGYYVYNILDDQWTSSEILDHIFGIDDQWTRNAEGWLKIVHPVDRQEMAAYLTEHVIKDQNAFDKEYRISRANDSETRWVHGMGKLDFDKNGNPVRMIGVIRDITHSKLIHEQLKDALHEAERSTKIKSLFLANISHEIRTPLNSIIGFGQILQDNFKNRINEEEKKMFEIINYSTQRLMDTIHEVLDISLIESGNMKTQKRILDLDHTVQKILKSFNIKATKKGLEVSYSNESNIPYAKIDLHSFSKGMTNLVDNALKYTEEGNIKITLSDYADQLMLEISDTGVGISEDYLDHIFDLFSQESTGYSKKYEGLGLGMAIAKKCFDLNEIRLDISSQKGVGTTIRLYLNKPDEETLKTIKRKETLFTLDNITTKSIQPHIMIVEDDQYAQESLSKVLSEKFNLIPVMSVDHAIEELENKKIDLVIADLSLKGDKDGIDLIRHIRKTHAIKNMPIIVITAHAFKQDKKNAMEAGCDAFITKPYNFNKLIKTINSNLGIDEL